MCRVVVPIFGLLVAAGCASSTPVAVVEGGDASAVHRDVVLDCRVGLTKQRPNLTFKENLFPYPGFPSEGYVFDLPLRVESVRKGRYGASALRISDAQGPGDRERRGESMLRKLTYDEPVTLGFNRGPFGARRDYVLVRRPADRPRRKGSCRRRRVGRPIVRPPRPAAPRELLCPAAADARILARRTACECAPPVRFVTRHPVIPPGGTPDGTWTRGRRPTPSR